MDLTREGAEVRKLLRDMKSKNLLKNLKKTPSPKPSALLLKSQPSPWGPSSGGRGLHPGLAPSSVRPASHPQEDV